MASDKPDEAPDELNSVERPDDSVARPEYGAEEGTVRVAVRIRPLIPRETLNGCETCISIPSETVPQIRVADCRAFTYDQVFGPSATQEEVHRRTALPMLRGVMNGYNCTILAYGQTGSGKTYTMGSGLLGSSEADVGIIPRLLQRLFDDIQRQAEREDNATEFTLRVQMLELYGESLRDLLYPAEDESEEPLSIRETEHGVEVAGANWLRVASAEEALAALEDGSARRTTGSTAMNTDSSRSHAVFTISVEQRLPLGSGDVSDEKERDASVMETRVAHFNFVDLAGSERAKRTQTTGVRMKEGIQINRGLLALGNVISALGDDKRRAKLKHIPYRDSKLTRLLQDSLGGNSLTLMIACVSPADNNLEESLNTLRYANRARNIKNKPVVNRDPNASLIAQLRAEVAQLRRQLQQVHGRGGAAPVSSLAGVFERPQSSPAGHLERLRDGGSLLDTRALSEQLTGTLGAPLLSPFASHGEDDAEGRAESLTVSRLLAITGASSLSQVMSRLQDMATAEKEFDALQVQMEALRAASEQTERENESLQTRAEVAERDRLAAEVQLGLLQGQDAMEGAEDTGDTNQAKVMRSHLAQIHSLETALRGAQRRADQLERAIAFQRVPSFGNDPFVLGAKRAVTGSSENTGGDGDAAEWAPDALERAWKELGLDSMDFPEEHTGVERSREEEQAQDEDEEGEEEQTGKENASGQRQGDACSNDEEGPNGEYAREWMQEHRQSMEELEALVAGIEEKEGVARALMVKNEELQRLRETYESRMHEMDDTVRHIEGERDLLKAHLEEMTQEVGMNREREASLARQRKLLEEKLSAAAKQLSKVKQERAELVRYRRLKDQNDAKLRALQRELDEMREREATERQRLARARKQFQEDAARRRQQVSELRKDAQSAQSIAAKERQKREKLARVLHMKQASLAAQQHRLQALEAQLRQQTSIRSSPARSESTVARAPAQRLSLDSNRDPSNRRRTPDRPRRNMREGSMSGGETSRGGRVGEWHTPSPPAAPAGTVATGATRQVSRRPQSRAEQALRSKLELAVQRRADAEAKVEELEHLLRKRSEDMRTLQDLIQRRDQLRGEQAEKQEGRRMSGKSGAERLRELLHGLPSDKSDSAEQGTGKVLVSEDGPSDQESEREAVDEALEEIEDRIETIETKLQYEQSRIQWAEEEARQASAAALEAGSASGLAHAKDDTDAAVKMAKKEDVQSGPDQLAKGGGDEDGPNETSKSDPPAEQDAMLVQVMFRMIVELKRQERLRDKDLATLRLNQSDAERELQDSRTRLSHLRATHAREMHRLRQRASRVRKNRHAALGDHENVAEAEEAEDDDGEDEEDEGEEERGNGKADRFGLQFLSRKEPTAQAGEEPFWRAPPPPPTLPSPATLALRQSERNADRCASSLSKTTEDGEADCGDEAVAKGSQTEEEAEADAEAEAASLWDALLWLEHEISGEEEISGEDSKEPSRRDEKTSAEPEQGENEDAASEPRNSVESGADENASRTTGDETSASDPVRTRLLHLLSHLREKIESWELERTSKNRSMSQVSQERRRLQEEVAALSRRLQDRLGGTFDPAPQKPRSVNGLTNESVKRWRNGPDHQAQVVRGRRHTTAAGSAESRGRSRDSLLPKGSQAVTNRTKIDRDAKRRFLARYLEVVGSRWASETAAKQGEESSKDERAHQRGSAKRSSSQQPSQGPRRPASFEPKQQRDTVRPPRPPPRKPLPKEYAPSSKAVRSRRLREDTPAGYQESGESGLVRRRSVSSAASAAARPTKTAAEETPEEPAPAQEDRG